jgi:hypothetical protein
VFEEEESYHVNDWIGKKTFVEYHMLPKSSRTYMFANPNVWESVMIKLKRAIEERRDVSTSEGSRVKKTNKSSPVKVEEVLRPVKELARLENQKKAWKTAAMKKQGSKGPKKDEKEKASKQQPVEEVTDSLPGGADSSPGGKS